MVLLKKLKRIPKKQQIVILLSVGFLLVLGGILLWAITTGKIKPSANSIEIHNQATVTYQDQSGNTVTVPSNEVIVQVVPSLSASLALSPSSGTKNIGELFDIQILLTTGNQTTTRADAVISYNTQDLEVQDQDTSVSGIQLKKGTILTQALNTVDTTNGKIKFSGTGSYTGTNGVLATIKFKALRAANPTAVSFAFTSGNTDESNVLLSDGLDILEGVTNGTYILNTPSQNTTFNITYNLQGRVANNYAASAVVFEVFTPGGTTAIASKNDVTIDASGNGTAVLSNLNNGTYDLKIRVPNFLSKRKANVAVTTTTSIDFGQLLTGDIDNNNEVNAYDYSALLNSWRKRTGETGFNPIADIQQNGEINIYDYSILITNWRKRGDS